MVGLPVQEPVIIFAIAMLIFFLTPLLMKKMRIPGIIGPILAGVIIGPHGIHLLERDQTMELLGTVGLLFIIFIAGLELDIDGFKKYRNRSILFGSISFTIPLLIGTAIGLALDYGMAASVLLGSIVGSHTLLAYPIASRLGITKNKALTTAVGGTLLTDTAALLLLAVITGAAEGQLTLPFWINMAISIAVFVFIILWGIPVISRWFFRNAENEGILNFTYVMVILFVSGSLAIIAGMEPIIGAFLAGLALNRFVLEHGTLMNRIRFLGSGLFIPFFLLSVGMLMNLGVLISEPKAWILTIAVLLAVFIGKMVAPLVISRVYHYSKLERNVIFGLTIPQAASTLAATLVGYEVGLLDQATVNAVIIMILITCILGPYLVEKHGRQLGLIEKETTSSMKQVPERILIPIANPDTTESLIDLASTIKYPNSEDQPLYPLNVVVNEVGSAKEDVAKAEQMLGHAVMYASGSEIPVRLITRVDQNVSSGVVRAVMEERISTVVVGWNAQSKPNLMYGSILDRIIDETHQAVLVTKLGHPLRTTERIVLIVPFGVDHKPGFHNAIERIKLLTSRLSATLLVWVIGGSIDIYEQRMKKIKPNPPTEFRRVENWTALKEEVILQLQAADLVMVLSARKGTIAWHPQLEEFPKLLSKSNSESFIMYYPAEDSEVDMRGATGTEVPKEVLRGRDYDGNDGKPGI